MPRIQFFFPQPVSFLKERQRLKSFLVKTAAKGLRPLNSLNIIFCDDKYLLSINQQFLKHDFYTDIITFDLSPSRQAAIDAEIYISVDRIRENANSIGAPCYKELHRVIFHGLLHLLGHGDKTKRDKEIMRSLEDALIDKYFSMRSA